MLINQHFYYKRSVVRSAEIKNFVMGKCHLSSGDVHKHCIKCFFKYIYLVYVLYFTLNCVLH